MIGVGHKSRWIVICLVIICFANFAYASSLKDNHAIPKNWSIVVSSCDKYSDLWSPFFKALELYWPELSSVNKDTPIYLIANQKKYDSARVQTLQSNIDISWSDNMLDALEKVNTPYILLFLEDYWINARVDLPRLKTLMDLVERKDAAYLELAWEPERLRGQPLIDSVTGVAYKKQFQNYRASLQLALWEKKALQQILRRGEDAWVFERAASIRSSGYPKPFFVMLSDLPISYLNAAHQGHVSPAALAFAKKHNIAFTSEMPVLQEYNWRFWLKSAKNCFKNLSQFIKRKLFESEQNYYPYVFE